MLAIEMTRPLSKRGQCLTTSTLPLVFPWLVAPGVCVFYLQEAALNIPDFARSPEAC